MQFMNSSGENSYVYDLSESSVERIESLRLPEFSVFFNSTPIDMSVKCFVVPYNATILIIEGEKRATSIIDEYKTFVQNSMERLEASSEASYYYAFAWKNPVDNQFLIMMGQGAPFEYLASKYIKEIEVRYQNIYSSFVNLEDFDMPEEFNDEEKAIFLNSIDSDYQISQNIKIWEVLQNQTPEVYSVLLERQGLEQNINETINGDNHCENLVPNKI